MDAAVVREPEVRRSQKWLLFSFLLAAGAVTSVAAFMLRAIRFGSLPASVSPVGLLAIAATLCFCFAFGILWTDAGRRMDQSFAAEESALLVVGALTTAKVKQILLDWVPMASHYLPTRVSLVATNAGVEIWGRPRRTVYVTIPWTKVENVSVGRRPGVAGSVTTLCFDQLDAKLRLEVRIAGSGITGFSAADSVATASIANSFMQLRRTQGQG